MASAPMQQIRGKRPGAPAGCKGKPKSTSKSKKK